jgi:hypothetical protein
MTPYDPTRDLYQLLGVASDAGEDELRRRIEGLRGTGRDPELDEAAAVLLDIHTRTAYDTQRATHRMHRIMRDSLRVFAGPGGVPGASADLSAGAATRAR